MNTKLLKQKILDLAIRGKLTQQLKSDGNTADLLKEISSACHPERSAKGAKSKDLKQIIPLDKNEAPFEIPANWEWVRIGDIFNLQAGKNIAAGLISSTCEDCYYPCFGGNGLRGFVSCFNREGDYPLIGRQGALCGNINRATGKFYATEHAVVVETNSMMNVSLACFFLTQLNLNQYASSTAQPGLSVAKINEVPIPLPPLAEQQRIVEKIEEAFAEIDAVEKNKELLKTHIKQTRQKILDLAIHGKLVPQNKSDEPASVLLERITRDNPHYEKIEDEPFEIPENWAWCRLRNLSESIQYGYNAPAKDSGRIKMVRISDIHENEVEWDSVPYCDIDDKEIQTYLLKKNDILFARTGGTVGKSFIVSNLPEDAVYAGYLIRTRYGKNANAQYMKYFMESNLYWEQLRDGCIATAQPNCNGKTLGKMQIPLPPLNEQSRIVAKIEELFSTLDQMERNLV